jgi:hypothetical protein
MLLLLETKKKITENRKKKEGEQVKKRTAFQLVYT